MCIPLHGVTRVKPTQIFTKSGMPASFSLSSPARNTKPPTAICASVGWLQCQERAGINATVSCVMSVQLAAAQEVPFLYPFPP